MGCTQQPFVSTRGQSDKQKENPQGGAPKRENTQGEDPEAPKTSYVREYGGYVFIALGLVVGGILFYIYCWAPKLEEEPSDGQKEPADWQKMLTNQASQKEQYIADVDRITNSICDLLVNSYADVKNAVLQLYPEAESLAEIIKPHLTKTVLGKVQKEVLYELDALHGRVRGQLEENANLDVGVKFQEFEADDSSFINEINIGLQRKGVYISLQTKPLLERKLEAESGIIPFLAKVVYYMEWKELVLKDLRGEKK